jgi:hypothetical protein
MAARSQGMTAIRLINATAVTVAVPTAATDGIPVWPEKGAKRMRVHLLCESGAASGNRSHRVYVHGYVDTKFSAAETNQLTLTDLTAPAWYRLFDTETVLDAADFNMAYELEVPTDFKRLAVSVPDTPGGTTPTLTVSLGFPRDDQRR